MYREDWSLKIKGKMPTYLSLTKRTLFFSLLWLSCLLWMAAAVFEILSTQLLKQHTMSCGIDNFSLLFGWWPFDHIVLDIQLAAFVYVVLLFFIFLPCLPSKPGAIRVASARPLASLSHWPYSLD